jgi:hypothetical protein
MRKTRTIALSIKSAEKITTMCNEIKDKTGEFVAIGEMVAFLIEKLGRIATDLKIKKILEEKMVEVKLTEQEMEEILSEIDERYE